MKISLADTESSPYISKQLLRHTLEHLQELDFIESTGHTSGLRYILHKSKIKTTGEKIKYSQLKRQGKAKQREAVMRYINTVGTIINAEAREILNLTETSQSYVPRLLSELWREGHIDLATPEGNFKRVYKKKE